VENHCDFGVSVENHCDFGVSVENHCDFGVSVGPFGGLVALEAISLTCEV
jgi:hypothetical protein